jgi:hypothetical protein
MRRPALTWIAAALGLVATGCGDAKLETRTLCYTVNDVAIPGASGSGKVAIDLGYDVAATLPDLTSPGVTYTLTLQHLELLPSKGSPVTDLGGLTELDVSILPPGGSTLPAVQLIRYVESAGAHPTRIQAAAERQPNLRPYLASGQLGFQVQAAGTLPTVAWGADATACFLLDVNVRSP